jgi:hypothetical protein
MLTSRENVSQYPQLFPVCSGLRLSVLCLFSRICLFQKTNERRGENHMALQAQEQETLNVKLVHFTKQNSPDEPVQVAFSVTDEQGKEEIITGEIPYSYDLFRLFQEQGWLNLRRGVSSIRESRGQRRAMSA